ncbi:MAG TPA: VOC family protein [Acidimicrobiales bacterium]|nr:VOC family protein [Acidimicrobiales bacterium]
MSAIVNHVGLAVSDLDRSRRFYEEVLGFAFRNEITVPDGAVSHMFGLDAPIGMRAAYLTIDGVVLELMAFERGGVAEARERPFNEPGLTHLSICVDDVEDTESKAAAYGGEVLADRSFKGMVSLVRDPDGQLIELLPMTYRDTL